MDIRFEKVGPGGYKAVALASKHAFDDNLNYGAPDRDWPRGSRSETMQSVYATEGLYYQILDGYRVIGGVLAYDRRAGNAELERLFVEPAYQRQGIGALALAFIESELPHAHHWTSKLPAWNVRACRFLERHGYTRLGDAVGNFWYYEKQIVGPPGGIAGAP